MRLRSAQCCHDSRQSRVRSSTHTRTGSSASDRTTMRLSLHHRIVLPFAAVAVIATSAVAWVAYKVTTTTTESRIRADIANATSVASRSGMALNPAILTAIKQATGGDVVTFSGGTVISTTLDAPDRDALAARVM